ncbi:MAG: AAA family ATPase [Pseudomonadota bacterium]
MDHYTSFFNLKENPFVLTPDPKYLYLGHKHREVMGHLLYGIKEDKGFMVVVGEVGTGKTTLCRAFINQLLKENIEVGLIYNPAMTDLELLQAVNREYKLASDLNTKGRLIDALNEFLLRVNGQGRKVVLIIDEAQNLYPSVLEQLRLISNLETETGKLIQIILVGQPELERILAKKEMRQLDQRVVVRGLLGPFNQKETRNYLRHRLQVAMISESNNNASFSDGACRVIYKLCRGVPRLINVLADRTLLVAYAQGKRKIDGSTVKKARRDLERSRYRSKTRPLALRWQSALMFCIFALVLLGWHYQEVFFRKTAKSENKTSHKATGFAPPVKRKTAPSETPQEAAPAVGIPINPPAAPPVAPPVAPRLTLLAPVPVQKKAETIEKGREENPQERLNRFLRPLEGLPRQENWQLVLGTVFRLWGEERAIPADTVIGALPGGSRLEIWKIYGNLTRLRIMNYPAIVELKRAAHPEGVFAVLKTLKKDHVVLVGKEDMLIPLDTFNNLWFGHAFIPWKDFEGLPQVISPGSSDLSVTWLQHNLKYLKLLNGPVNGFYDAATKASIVRLQKEMNLTVDGIVGPRTKMALYSLLDIYPNPSLTDPEDKETGNP